MFALYCPQHGHQILLDLDQLIRVVNLGDGMIVIEARCYDGEPLTAVTGLGATLPPEQVAHRPTVPATSGRASPVPAPRCALESRGSRTPRVAAAPGNAGSRLPENRW
jgi:hypothetical protein